MCSANTRMSHSGGNGDMTMAATDSESPQKVRLVTILSLKAAVVSGNYLMERDSVSWCRSWWRSKKSLTKKARVQKMDILAGCTAFINNYTTNKRAAAN